MQLQSDGADDSSILLDWRRVRDHLDDAVFVLDSCVYLHLYRPTPVQAELATALRFIQNRLWVPHQVMVEVLDNSRTISAAILRESQQAADEVARFTNQAVLVARRALQRTSPDVRAGGAALRAFREASRSLQGTLLSGGTNDSNLAGRVAAESPGISTEIKELMAGRAGVEPSRERYDRWVSDSQQRVRHRLPPSHGDRRKKEPSRHNDCVIWHQILEFALSQDEPRPLVFVTRDVKEDGWVEHRNGSVVGAHPHLRQEIMTAAQTPFIVMGTADLLAYPRNAEVRRIWEKDRGWGAETVPGPLRPVPSFFP